MPKAAKKVKPFTDEQHQKMGESLAELGGELMDMQESVHNAYAHSTEPARAVRDFVRAYNRVRAALVSRFFGEGHSTDGTSPYYPKGGRVVKPAEQPDGSDEPEGEDDGEPE